MLGDEARLPPARKSSFREQDGMFCPPRSLSCVSKRRDETDWISTFTVGTLNVSYMMWSHHFENGEISHSKWLRLSLVKSSRPRMAVHSRPWLLRLLGCSRTRSSGRTLCGRPSGYPSRFRTFPRRESSASRPFANGELCATQRRKSPSRSTLCVSKHTETNRPGSPTCMAGTLNVSNMICVMHSR